jgi:hypothetical protein
MGGLVIIVYILVILALHFGGAYLIIKKSFVRKTPLLGLLIGLYILSYDYDFFLNAGGPETEIGDYIVKTFSLDYHHTFFYELVILPTMCAIAYSLILYPTIYFLKKQNSSLDRKY